MSRQAMKVDGENNSGRRHVWIKPGSEITLNDINRAIDAKVNELVNQRLNGIIDGRIQHSKTVYRDTLPNGAPNPIGPHGFILGQKWYPAFVNYDGNSRNSINQLSLVYRPNNDVINKHDDNLAKVGILHITNSNYSRDNRIKIDYQDRKYIIEEDFPIFFSYLKRINYPFEWINNKRSYTLFSSNRDYDNDGRSTVYTPAKDFYIYVGDAR